MSLIEDAKAAKEAGVSYGEYMLQRKFVPYEKPTGRRCEICGGILTRYQKKFCCKECRDEMKIRESRGDVFV
jgi:hypothetical protein